MWCLSAQRAAALGARRKSCGCFRLAASLDSAPRGATPERQDFSYGVQAGVAVQAAQYVAVRPVLAVQI
jgi:hypothetical protein